jgi:hypothetical protein
MKLMPLLVLVAVFAAPSCRTGEDEVMWQDAEIPCTCGGPDDMFDGCANSLCISGQNNPSNPSCVCGNLEIGPTGGN